MKKSNIEHELSYDLRIKRKRRWVNYKKLFLSTFITFSVLSLALVMTLLIYFYGG